MGKAARAACIFFPWALTAASLVLLLLMEIAGWGKHGTLNDLYFIKANLTDLSVSDTTNLDNTTTLTAALEYARDNDLIAHVYDIHLWNYCSSDVASGKIDYCSPRHKDYYFNPVDSWHLNDTANSEVNGVAGIIKDNEKAIEEEVLGESGEKALATYQKVATWMFIAYAVAFWSTVATLVVAIFAVFSRIGSFLTWTIAVISTLFTIGATATSTVLFTVLTGALHELLKPYNVTVALGTKVIIISWIASACSLIATLFWLFSMCCCSGRSNPHHRSNKNGLWAAEQKGRGYAGPGGNSYWTGGRNRSLRVEKTGGAGQGAYERVGSPFVDPAARFSSPPHQGGLSDPPDANGNGMQMSDYPARSNAAHHRYHDSGANEFPLNTEYNGAPQGGAYEPFRHA